MMSDVKSQDITHTTKEFTASPARWRTTNNDEFHFYHLNYQKECKDRNRTLHNTLTGKNVETWYTNFAVSLL